MEYTYVLGVPNFANYEASASLIRVPRGGGEIAYVSIGEDRLTRTKHTYAFPLRGIQYCLEAFGLESLEQIDFIYTDYARLPRWLNSGPGYRKLEHDYLKLRLRYPRERIRVVDHHDGHAASAFYPSPFDEAAVLVVDSLGSRLNTQTLYHFRADGAHEIERGDHWGIGRLYSLVTGSVLPYGPEKGFGKTMGLAPYGAAHPGPVLEFSARDQGMSSDYSAFFSRPPLPRIVAAGVRRCEDRERVLDPYFARAAYDVQLECERQMVRMAEYAYERTGSRNLCIAGGTGLNGLANARVLQRSPFEQVWVPPGCSDAGLSLGLALWGYFRDVAGPDRARVTVSMTSPYTGRSYAREAITRMLDHYGIAYRAVEPEAVAPHIAAGKVIGWFEGGSEFGPRALGHRSILADPREASMKDTLNTRVKFREPYRPYAPSVLAEHAREWLDLDADSPFMLMVVDVREDKRARVPAITHVDNTTRPQTVTPAVNPHYHRLISAFHRLTGVPMVLNTSLNINREPIVETPIDALICVFGTAIDLLYIEGLLIECPPYGNPEMVARLTADRTQTLAEEWTAITARHLTRYDTAERDAYLAEENRIAEWHREYRAKYELEQRLAVWSATRAKVVIVGTRGHTRCLYEYLDGVARLDVAAFVPMDDQPGEPGELSVYREASLDAVDWPAVDAVLVSTHEYQALALSRLRPLVRPGADVLAMYDDAGDSLLHVLPGRWPVVNALPSTGTRAVDVVPGSIDFEFNTLPTRIAERYALIVSYHYCHPSGGWLKGTKSITPEELDAQLRVLTQNFVCTTIGELMNPAADLPETVAVVTFDDGFKDVVEHALPLLERWSVPATVYCCSAPLLENTVLNVHRVHLLQAKLGLDRFREAFEELLASRPPVAFEPNTHPGLLGLYPYDEEPTRRFKRLLNFDLPYHELDPVLRTLFERFIGQDEEIASKLYLSASDLRQCQDAGLEIGVHGHSHRVLSRLTGEEQRIELGTCVDHLREVCGLTDVHASYPYGIDGSWNEATKQVAAALGLASASTKVRAIVKPSDLRRRWELPRYDVRDVFDASGTLVSDRLSALFTAD
ncbi:MAG TPA: carbamoyltransferase C-terminal domain-containing protein [Vicinamibacterales bacterium]|nr:carbamoyltransferase C-terminal domain-containing protein [Vicinamibacterales bacterium]